MRSVAVILSLLVSAGVLCGEPARQAYALIVAGEGVEPNFSENYKDWAGRMQKVLVADSGIPAANVSVLTESKDIPAATGISKKENVLAELKSFAGKVKAGDQFVLVFIGHGTQMNKVGKLCLAGPDLTSEETAEALGKIPGEIVFIHSGACADAFVEKASAVGRIIITATNNSGEGNETYFMEFFLRGLEKKTADHNKNGTVEVLEAFNYAATECPKWYMRQYFDDKAGEWRTEGKQSRELWKKFYGKVPDKKLGQPQNPDADDAEPVLGEWGPQWDSRRMVPEHAQLDDNGDRQGTAVYVADFTPLPGTEEGADGWYARTAILGKPTRK